jgi:CBS domain containing-hemolysin-like protein
MAVWTMRSAFRPFIFFIIGCAVGSSTVGALTGNDYDAVECEDRSCGIGAALRFLQESGYVVCRRDDVDVPDRSDLLRDEDSTNSAIGFAVPYCHHLAQHPSERVLVSAEELEEDSSEMLTTLLNLLAALACVTTAALAAGLTLGLLGLDPLMLLIKQRAGETPEERQMATDLLPIVKQHHLLLVTLLLMNASSNEALPIFLEALVPSSVAVLLSVTLVLFFGEIIPSAVFTGPDQLKIASRLSPLVKTCMFVLYPVAGPIAKLLDYILHDDEEHEAYNRGELSALIRIQYEERLAAKRKKKKERARAHRILREQEEEAARAKAAEEEIRRSGSDRRDLRPSPWTHLLNQLGIGAKKSTGVDDSNDVKATPFPLPRVGALDFEPSDGVRLSQMVQEEVDLRALKNHLEYAEERGQDRIRRHERQVSWHHQRSMSIRSDATPHRPVEFFDESSPMLNSSFGGDDFSQFTGPTTDSLHQDEVLIVEGALAMKTKVALDLMRPKRLTYRLPHDLLLNERNLVDIYSSGFSRVPVYRNTMPGGGGGAYDRAAMDDPSHCSNAICGVLITKQLIVVNPADCRPLHTLPLYCPTVVGPRTRLVDLLNQLQSGGSSMKGGHLALVCANVEEATAALNRGEAIPATSGWMGIVTLEDVIESVLQEEIYDEYDNIRSKEQRLGKMLRAAWLRYKKRKARRPGLSKEASHRKSTSRSAPRNDPTNELTALLALPNP